MRRPKRPYPTIPVVEAEPYLLPLGTIRRPCALETHPVAERTNRFTIEQSVDHISRVLRGLTRHRAQTIFLEVRRSALALIILCPALFTFSDQEPAAAVGGHVAVNALRGVHFRSQEPVAPVRGGRMFLFDFPA